MEAILELFKGLVESQGANIEIVGKILMVIGMLRVVFKPLMSLVQAVVGATPDLKDDSILAKVMEHKAYKIVAYLLDWSASIKLPQKPKV